MKEFEQTTGEIIIDKILNDKNLMRNWLKLDKLERLLNKLTKMWGQTITWTFNVEENQNLRKVYKFNVKNNENLATSSGIFAKVMIEVTLNSVYSLMYVDDDGTIHINFELNISYIHFHGEHNSLKIGQFTFENNEWKVIDTNEK